MPRKYIWERPEWPDFRWQVEPLMDALTSAHGAVYRLLGLMEGLGFDLQLQTETDTITEDVIKTSAIEGETLDRVEVRSSVAKKLGLPDAAVRKVGQDTEGVVQMTLDAVKTGSKPLTKKQLFEWHKFLFPTGQSGFSKIRTGKWRDDKLGPMVVGSGRYGDEKVFFQAPPAERLEQEMATFLEWFNASKPSFLRAAQAHLWFVTIHPFDDGNGRLARAIADRALMQADGSSQRFYSMSSQILKERNGYYDILEQTQKGSLDVTDWMIWFLETLAKAAEAAEINAHGVLEKARYWVKHAGVPISDRQKLVLNRVLSGFEGKLTAAKWAKLAKTSESSALRDIRDLIEKRMLVSSEAGGRSTSYDLV